MNDEDQMGDSAYYENNAVITQPAQAMQQMPAQPMAMAQASTLALQERMAKVQMRYMIAMQRPRNIVNVELSVKRECERFGLAAMAQYALPVGGKTHRGLSIRLAEVLLQKYGNASAGKEIVGSGEDHMGIYSDVRVFALDFETGSEFEETIRVHHHRMKNVGQQGARNYIKQAITDQSELERLIAQQAAKRLRKCITQIIPGDLQEKALRWCKDTVAKGEGNVPIIERAKQMVVTFERMGAKREQLEKKLSCKMELWTGNHLEELTAIGRSITDGEETLETWFGDPNATEPGDAAARMKAQVAARKAAKTEAPAKEGEAK